MNKKVFIIDDKSLMNEWNWEKNGDVNPNSLTCGSNKKVWWKCGQNHEWEDTITHRVNGRNCPYCSNHRLLKGYNDLATIYPQLVLEWNYNKNSLLPHEIFPYSNKKVWWTCEKGHEWEDTPNHRVSRRNGCPYCSNHKPLEGYNDLTTTHPKLVDEWDYDKNGDLYPTKITFGSNKKIWWKCARGHEWQATVNSRSSGNNCPYCKKEMQTSFPEQAIYFYIKKFFPKAINRYIENKKELDIFIPNVNIGIEYDGMYYHSTDSREKETKKDNYFFSKGIHVIRIKETNNIKTFKKIGNIIYYSPKKSYKNLNLVILELFKIISKLTKIYIPEFEISVEKENISIMELFVSVVKDNSIMGNRVLAREWNYEKNKGLNPHYFSINSGKKVWWICKEGHEWRAVIASRNSGVNCPYCSNQKIIAGYNDLRSRFPELANQWHPIKNGELSPNNVPCGSNKKVWWLCEKGHEWQANIQPRTKGVGCPYCSNQKIAKGYNDLLSLNPSLSKQWHPTKNYGLLPSVVSCGSGKKVWWMCEKGHEWQAIIKNRNNGAGCPICYKKEPKFATKKRINAYNVNDLSFFGSFEDAKSFCLYAGLDYKKCACSISSVCRRRQKTLIKKYILRYDIDDELKK